MTTYGNDGPASDKLLLTPEAAAAMASVSRTTMFGLMKLGVVESVKIGRARRIPVEALRAYVDGLRSSAAA